MVTPKTDVFIVDDDVSVREALEAVLQDDGLSVQTFCSAETLLDGVRSACPYCIVLDVHLPGLNGLQLQQLLHVECPSVPIIFITGIGDIPMSVKAMKNGATEFLTKPFSDASLLSAVRAAVETGKKSQFEEHDMKVLKGRYAQLTPREKAVFPLVVAGYANKNVGFELGISEITVKAHRGSVMRKLKAESLAGLIQMAIKLDVLPDSSVSS